MPKRRLVIAVSAAAVVLLAAGFGTAYALDAFPPAEPEASAPLSTLRPSPSETPTPEPTTSPQDTGVIAMCPESYLQASGVSSATTSAIQSLNEPTTLDAGLVVECGYEWSDSSLQYLVFQGTRDEGGQMKAQLEAAGYGCGQAADAGAWFYCSTFVGETLHSVDIVDARGATDELSADQLFEVDIYASTSCGLAEEANVYCIAPW